METVIRIAGFHKATTVQSDSARLAFPNNVNHLHVLNTRTARHRQDGVCGDSHGHSLVVDQR